MLRPENRGACVSKLRQAELREQRMAVVARARETASDAEQDSKPATEQKQCDVCGQVFDLADLDQIFHHDGRPHEALIRKP